jgi:hypothetical protein
MVESVDGAMVCVRVREASVTIAYSVVEHRIVLTQASSSYTLYMYLSARFGVCGEV